MEKEWTALSLDARSEGQSGHPAERGVKKNFGRCAQQETRQLILAKNEEWTSVTIPEAKSLSPPKSHKWISHPDQKHIYQSCPLATDSVRAVNLLLGLIFIVNERVPSHVFDDRMKLDAKPFQKGLEIALLGPS